MKHNNQQPGSADKFGRGDTVRKSKGSQWSGKVVGFYSTDLTPEGYAVESATELGSVQIYPAAALELVERAPVSAVPADNQSENAELVAHVVDFDRDANESIINVALEAGTAVYFAPYTGHIGSESAVPAVQVAMPEPAAWIRKTDITELTDSEPETNGWTPLFAAQPAEGSALVARPEQDQAHVMPPTRGTDSQQGASVAKLREVATWIDSQCNQQQISPEEFCYPTQFDYDLAQAASELFAIAGAIEQSNTAGSARQGGNTQSQQDPVQQLVLPERSDTPAPEWNAAMEEAAQLCETVELLFDPVEILNSTKNELTAITARKLAKEIRALKRIDGDKQGAQGEKA